MKKLEFKKDKYKKTRGGYSRFLNVSCTNCGNFIALYQKDGPGPLKRLYLDRIFAPQTLVGLEEKTFKKLPALACKKCQQVVGVPFLYRKEKRPSFRLFQGAVSKRIIRIS